MVTGPWVKFLKSLIFLLLNERYLSLPKFQVGFTLIGSRFMLIIPYIWSYSPHPVGTRSFDTLLCIFVVHLSSWGCLVSHNRFISTCCYTAHVWGDIDGNSDGLILSSCLRIWLLRLRNSTKYISGRIWTDNFRILTRCYCFLYRNILCVIS
jgi:hypothetical protein